MSPERPDGHSLSTLHKTLLVALLALCIWLPRGLALDRFATADEHAWLARSGNFYRALAHGDWAGTFQRHHPGVTITWAGTLGFLADYPAYAGEAPREFGWLTEEIEPFLQAQGHTAIDMLAAGRRFAVLAIALALLSAFAMAVRLVGWPSALLGFGLIAFDPFHLGLSRLLHLDGTLSSFMLLALLAFLVYLARGERYALALSALAAGLAWLTRSPGLFLVPFVGVTGLGWWLTTPGSKGQAPRPGWGRVLGALVVWGVLGLVVFVLLWPAMWVAPVESLRQVLSAASEYAAEGHLKPTFFNGEVYGGDPGWIFYPVSYLWRTTPIALMGLVLAVAGLLLRRGSFADPIVRRTTLVLLLYALLFGLFMNVGAKKFDRYLLPSFVALDLVAGVGWWWGVSSVTRRMSIRERWPEAAGWGLLALIVIVQAGLALPAFPYYLSYYNPLMGGSARAPEVMMIGWGEGADRAGRWLAQEPNAAETTVASAYTNGPFSYFYPGETLPIYFWHDAEYAVLYAQDRQRRLPAPRQIAYFEGLTPVHTVRLNGLDYAWVYDMRDAPLPGYVTDWRTAEFASTEGDAAQIRLVSYQFPGSVVQPGETLSTILYFVNTAPIDANLNVIVRLVGADGTVIAREEGWPWGSPTDQWQRGTVWPDGHALPIPPETTPGIYRLDVAFNNPDGGLLTATRPATGEALGEYVTLDFVRIGSIETPPHTPLRPPANLNGLVALNGVTWRNASGAAFEPADTALAPGDALTATLAWEALATMGTDYTVFMHVVGPDGQPLTQADGPPLDGFFPTSFWQPGHAVPDPVSLTIPPDAPAGAYPVHVGMYEFATGDRLPIHRAGDPAGDSVVVGVLTVGQ